MFLESIQFQSGNFIKKETLAQVFSCGFCEISKNTFFYRTPPVAATVVRRNTKHKKDENTRIERKEIWKKSKRNRMCCCNIYIAIFAFLSSTEEVGRWKKLNEMFVFGILFIRYVWLLRHLWKFLWKFFENIVITFAWQLFAYFYQISNKCYCLIFLIDLFSWTVISSGSQKCKVRANLEVP